MIADASPRSVSLDGGEHARGQRCDRQADPEPPQERAGQDRLRRTARRRRADDSQQNPPATTRMPAAIGQRVPTRATRPPTNGETSRKTTDSGISAAPACGGAVAQPQLALQDDQVARGGERAVEQEGGRVDGVELPRPEQTRAASIGRGSPPLDRHQRGQAHDADDGGREDRDARPSPTPGPRSSRR